jgi:hypothetical protein
MIAYESIATDSVPRITGRTKRKSLLSSADYFNVCPRCTVMGENWTQERDKAVLNTVYYCETCNIIIEPGDADISIHKKELPHHKLRRVIILRCSPAETWSLTPMHSTALRRTSSGARTVSQKPGLQPSILPSTLFILQNARAPNIVRHRSFLEY